MKELVIKHLNLDIFALCETFLTGTNEVNIEGYKGFGNNRSMLHKKATRGSGGVGVLIKNDICNLFNVTTLDCSCDDILWLKLNGKNNDHDELVVCVCYIPPCGSSRGNVAQELYEHLLTNVYMYYDCSVPCIITGDFNARIGNLQEFNEGIESLKKRVCIDDIKKNYEDFLDFLNDSRFCVLNGRFEIENDNFTSVSSKGCAVVDYICVPYDLLQQVSHFCVITVKDLITGLNFQAGEISALPDHSILISKIDLSPYNHCCKEIKCTEAEHKINVENQKSNFICSQKRYRTQNINANIFENEHCCQALLNIINVLVQRGHTQNELNELYTKFVNILHSEMGRNLKTYESKSKNMRTGFKKPWWNNELKILFQKARTAEKNYLKKRKTGDNSSELRRIYVDKRKHFDKEYRRQKRIYLANNQAKLCELKTHDPKKFWEEISKVGPKNNKAQIPKELVLQDGTVTSDINVILKKWENNYKRLFGDSVEIDDSSDNFVKKVRETLNQWDSEYPNLLVNMNVSHSVDSNHINDNLNMA